MTEERTLVVGVGSPLMGDDGLGVRAVSLLREALPDTEGLEVADGGTWGMQLLPALEDATRLLVVDAVYDGQAPGTVIRLEKDELPRLLYQKVSPHQIDLREVFAVLELKGRFPREAVALGIEPEVVELQEELSPAVEASMPRLLEEVLSQLRAWGHDVPRTVRSGNA